MKNVRILISIVACSLFSFSPAHKAQKLQYVFKVGDQFMMDQITEQSISQSIMGMEQLIETSIKGGMSFKVQEITPTGAKLESQYTGMSLDMKLPAGMPAITMDSNGDAEKMENKVVKAMLNRPFTLYVSRQGVIEKIEGVENIFAGMKDLDLTDTQMAAMKSSLEQNINAASLKSSLEMVLNFYAETPVKIGDTWMNKVGPMGSFPTETSNTWTLKGLEKDVITLSAAGVTTTKDKDKVTSLPNGINTKFDLAGTQLLTSSAKTSNGWPTVVSVTSVTKGNMTLLAGGMIPQDMKVPMQITSKSSFKIVTK